MLCIPLKFLPGFLFGVSASRVKSEHYDKILRYRRECYNVLWDAFKHAIAPQTTALAPATTGGAALAYEIATAVQSLAREQMQQEQRLSTVEQSQDRARRWARVNSTAASRSAPTKPSPRANSMKRSSG